MIMISHSSYPSINAKEIFLKHNSDHATPSFKIFQWVTQAYKKSPNSLTLTLKSQLARDSKALLICHHHWITPPLLLNSSLPASFSPAQLFLSILKVLSQLFNLKFRDCLYFWFCNHGVHLNWTYWFIHNWSWIKEIRFQFCSFSSVLWWWLRGEKKEGSWQSLYL